MSDTGKQTPLGVNITSGILQGKGYCLNPPTVAAAGYSTTATNYTFGSVISSTCLFWVTYSINDAYARGVVNSGVYYNIINIGTNTIPGLGNTRPPKTYTHIESPNWAVQWTPSPPTRIATQWGYVKLYPWQGYNEFNYNNTLALSGKYNDFCGSFITSGSFIDYSNRAIMSSQNSLDYLEGTYSNMNDLTTADITNVSLATQVFGRDLINLGKSLDLSTIITFGYPSNLLSTLKKCNAMTPAVSVALLSVGLSPNEIDQITANSNVTKEQQQKIYAAFLILTGVDLAAILVSLNCNTQGLVTIADLLDVKKLFPNSYQTLTVPIYNATPGPTNSKTFYPIFSGSGLNSSLSSPTIKSLVGTTIPPGTPLPNTANSIPSATAQVLPEGFGSYLDGILPNDLAIAAGAFSASMQQIRNIKNVPIEKFAQITSTLEITNAGLNLINGTNIPTNKPEAIAGLKLIALGSGPFGTYTYSDFFGCMSGLKYPWAKRIQPTITNLQTDKLKRIYQQLFLAVTWDSPIIGVTYTTYQVQTDPGPPPVYTTYYHITGISVGAPGGGYFREDAPGPIVTFSNGGSVTCAIGQDPLKAQSQGGGTYGRITGAKSGTLNPGTDTTSVPTVTSVEYPPITNHNSPGVNSPYLTVGWSSPMNSIVQQYIDDANAEIVSIGGSNPTLSNELNDMWDYIGTQLTIEQKARNLGLRGPPLPNEPATRPSYGDIYPWPIILYSFTDTIPVYSKLTEPNMAVQTLEAISDMGKVSGQSTIGGMRAERNKERLLTAGIMQDVTISDIFPIDSLTKVVANGKITWVPPGETIPTSSAPAYPDAAKPDGYFDPETQNYLITNTPETTATEPTILGAPSPTVAAVLGIGTPGNLPVPSGDIGIGTAGISSVLGGLSGGSSGLSGGDPTPSGFFSGPGAGGGPNSLGGGPIVPGSLGGSPYVALIPVTLNPIYTSVSLMPASLTVAQAIEEVITCNCDCWVQ